MSTAVQTARMVLRAPEARAPVPIPVPKPAQRAAEAAAAVRVSTPNEPAEQEAERVAQAALAQPPRPRVQRSPPPASLSATRTPGPAGPVPIPYPNIGLDADGGRPLPRALRRDMEPRFGGADFSGVRIHTGDGAARASRRLNAAAFTTGSHIAFGRGRFQPERTEGRRLIAHELTHTIQQRGAAQPTGVQRSADTTVTVRSAPRVMRLGVQDALDYFADKAAWLPGFTMLTFLLGFNPISLRRVARTPANLLRALIQLLPGGPLITQALDNHGIVERVAAWAAGQLSILGDIGSMIRQNIDDFLDSLSWRDVFRLGSVWERAKRIVTGPIDRIIAFGRGLISGIVSFIKDAILRPLAGLVARTRGYPLLTALLGFDPITGDAVERSPSTLIGGFMILIGQHEVWQNIQRANAIPRAWAWFQGALAGLLGFVRQIPSQFINAFRALELIDIVVVPRAVARVIGVFAGIAGRFFSWAGGTVLSLLEIIFSVVAPGAMGYLRRAGAALASIFRNPIGFVRNLVRAAKLGFQQFARNFIGHLTSGLIAWLTGSLPGIHIPRAFSLAEILKFVMSVLGLTWANLRAKLVRAVGEHAVRAMEMGFDLVATLVREGPAAAWAQMREALGNLRAMVIDGIVRMVGQLMITRAIPRIVAMFIPGAGFISAIVSIYGTIMTFVRQLARIAQVVRSFLDSMMAIARGAVGAAAARVETTLAGLLTLAINFIAGFAGLGNMAARVRALIERIRAPIDRAMDRVVTWIVGAARRLGRFVAQAGVPNDPNERVRRGLADGVRAVNALQGRTVSAALIGPVLRTISVRYGLRILRAVDIAGAWWVEAGLSPVRRSVSTKRSGTAAEQVQSLDPRVPADLTRLLSLMRRYRFVSRSTSIEVSVLGRRIDSVRNHLGHAERDVVHASLPLVREFLATELAAGRLQAGQLVAVHLLMTRTPCHGCATVRVDEMLAALRGDTRLAALTFRIDIEATALTSDLLGGLPGLQRLVGRPDVRVTASELWEAIFAKFREYPQFYDTVTSVHWRPDELAQFRQAAVDLGAEIDALTTASRPPPSGR